MNVFSYFTEQVQLVVKAMQAAGELAEGLDLSRIVA